MRNLVLASLFLAACAPVASGEGDGEGENQAAITNGSYDSGDPAVALIHGSDGSDSKYTCTGTFLTPSLLLTAAHCFEESGLTFSVGVNPSYDFSDTTNPPTGLYTIKSYTLDPEYDPTTPIPHAHDFAVVRLSSNIGKATLPYHAGAPDSTWVGAAIHIVGYGRTTPNAVNEGTRRAVDTTIASYTATQLVITNHKQDCGGDSGGPAIMTLNGVQTIVGVAEAASTDCNSAGYYSRLDNDVAFINEELNSTGSTGGSSSGGSTGGSTMGGGCNVGGNGAPRLFGALALLVALVLRRRVA